MSLSDLLFLLAVFCTFVTLCGSLVALLRGRKSAALRAFCALGICLATYMLIGVVVGVSAPQKTLKMGEDRCFDEMCFAPTSVKIVPAVGLASNQIKANGNFYEVSIQASSHALGHAQREAGVSVSLIDSTGHVYEVSPQGQSAYEAANGPAPALTSRLQAGQRIISVQVFDVPRNASGLALHFGHNGPGLFIIGDDESPLHKPTITPLTQQ